MDNKDKKHDENSNTDEIENMDLVPTENESEIYGGEGDVDEAMVLFEIPDVRDRNYGCEDKNDKNNEVEDEDEKINEDEDEVEIPGVHDRNYGLVS